MPKSNRGAEGGGRDEREGEAGKGGELVILLKLSSLSYQMYCLSKKFSRSTTSTVRLPQGENIGPKPQARPVTKGTARSRSSRCQSLLVAFGFL